MYRSSLALLSLVLLLGCGLQLTGLGESEGGSAADEAGLPAEGEGGLDSGGIDGSVSSSADGSGADGADADAREAGPPDASSDVSLDVPDAADAADAPDVVEGGGDCLASVPDGWSVVVLEKGGAACPAGFTQHDTSGPPTFGAGACTCDCSVDTPGDCTTGTIDFAFGDSSSTNDCTQAISGSVDGPGCVPLAVALTVPSETNVEITPVAPSGGSCEGSDPVPDPSQMSMPSARYCDVPPTSAEAVCGGAVDPGATPCIAMSGQVTCPAGSPFSHPMTLSDGASLVCPQCGACTVSTQCTEATVIAFVDSQCTTGFAEFTADGTCEPIVGVPQSMTIVALEYTATATSTCTAGSSTPAALLADPVTLCCR